MIKSNRKMRGFLPSLLARGGSRVSRSARPPRTWCLLPGGEIPAEAGGNSSFLLATQPAAQQIPLPLELQICSC